jgi:hypothetical protein
MHFSALFPQACAVVAFVLSILCLLAGHRPGFMENYYIIMVSLSYSSMSATSANAPICSSTLQHLALTLHVTRLTEPRAFEIEAIAGVIPPYCVFLSIEPLANDIR